MAWVVPFFCVLTFSVVYGALYGVAHISDYHAVSVAKDGTLTSLNHWSYAPNFDVATVFNGSFYFAAANYTSFSHVYKWALSTGELSQATPAALLYVKSLGADSSTVYITYETQAEHILFSTVNEPTTAVYDFSRVNIDSHNYVYDSTIAPESNTYYILIFGRSSYSLGALSLSNTSNFQLSPFDCPDAKGFVRSLRLHRASNLNKFLITADYDGAFYYLEYDGSACRTTLLPNALHASTYDSSTSTFYYSYSDGSQEFLGSINAATGAIQTPLPLKARLELIATN